MAGAEKHMQECYSKIKVPVNSETTNKLYHHDLMKILFNITICQPLYMKVALYFNIENLIITQLVCNPVDACLLKSPIEADSYWLWGGRDFLHCPFSLYVG